MPQVRSVFAERVSQGFYVNVEVNRPEAAKYGLTVADVQQAVASGIGGENIAENIEGRERYPDQRPLPARFPRQRRELAQRADRDSFRRADSASAKWPRSRFRAGRP